MARGDQVGRAARGRSPGADPIRCRWAAGSELEALYHDEEWGVPNRDDQSLFEFLILEGAQAGLSWSTVLQKRATYRKAYRNFDPRKVARFDARAQARLLADPGIIRNRAKVAASISNARAFLEVQQEFGSFADYLWGFVGGTTLQFRRRSPRSVPSESRESRAMSKDLKQRGFRFVGPTICYAYMQATGMVNDHELRCFRHAQVQQLA